MCHFSVLPESVRWLALQGRDKEAIKIIQKAANWNKIKLTIDSDLKTPDNEEDIGGQNNNHHDDKISVDEVEKQKSGLAAIMTHPLLRRWSLNLYLNWSVNA